MSSKSADLKNKRIDPNVVRSVGDPSSTKAKTLQELDKKHTSSKNQGSFSALGPKRTAGEDKRTGPPAKKFEIPVYYPVGGGEPVVATGATPPVFCSKCGAEHHGNYCPKPCTICYSPDHDSVYCTFLSEEFPKDADFDRDHYYIACACGNPFNEREWACASCSGMPLLKLKYCGICNEYRHHLSHECPNDKERAAKYKARRDHDLLFGRYNTKKMPAGI